MPIPTDYTGLTGWWDASQDSFANNDPVGSWTDRSGNGHHLTNSGTARPTFKTGQFPLGGSGLDFDGTDDYLLSSPLLSSFITATAFTVIAVFIADAINSSGGTSQVWANDTVFRDQGGSVGIHLDNQSGTYRVQAYNSGTVGEVNQHIISLGTTYIVAMRHDGGNLISSVDGGSETSQSSGNTGDLGSVIETGRGGFGSPYEYLDGKIAELFIYNEARTAGEITALVDSLTTKWVTAPDTDANAGVASATGVANHVQKRHLAGVGLSAGAAHFDPSGGSTSITLHPVDAVQATGVANHAQKAHYAGSPTAAGAAHAPSRTVSFTAGVAASAAVTSSQPSVKPSSGAPSSTGAAHNATVSIDASSTSANASVASATGAANTVQAHVAPTVGNSAGVGAANNASVAVTGATNVNAIAALSTGAANGAVSSVAATAGNSLGAGSAHDPSVGFAGSPNAEPALAAGVTGATAGISVPTTVLAVTGSAFDATPGVSPNDIAIPISTSSPDASVAVAVSAGVASGVGSVAQANQPGPGQTITVRDRGHTVTVREQRKP